MTALKTWFKQQSEREQKLIILAGVAAIIGIFYFAIWSPLNNAIENEKRELADQKSTLTWVQQQANRAAILRQSGTAPKFSGSLTQFVNQTTRNLGISVSRMQPQGENLQIWIDEVSFNSLMTWLETVEERGIVIVSSDFSEVDTQGFVQVRRLVLGSS